MAVSGAGASRRVSLCRSCAILAAIALFAQLLLALHFLSLAPSAEPPHRESSRARSVSDAIDAGVSAARAPDVPSDDEDARPPASGPDRHLKLLELDFAPVCHPRVKEAVSAVHRAKTQTCKALIVNISCALQHSDFYPESLPDYCPHNRHLPRQPLGCFRDRKNFRLLSGYYVNQKESNEPDLCINMCLQGGFPYAGVQYSTECFCGETAPPSDSKIADTSCNMKCPGDPRHLCGGYFTMNVYRTGIIKFSPRVAAVTTDETTTPVRIVFLLTLNGRASRQVRRLINVLYDSRHYFFIHVDARQDYLHRELSSLEKEYDNIKLADKRFATIWGGASLLEMLLTSMKDLLSIDWKWDFVINLSESDFPVKSLEKLEEFLSANKGRNFVKSHGREVQRFIQKQGLDKTFVECDAHMWRIGDRKLPWGIQIDGGSDWVALDRKFVKYVISSPDSLLSGLLIVFKHTLLPAESFFHTVLRNSKFCDTYVDNNLHVTNWKRKLGCKCQYKHIVDWCGCSPNDFRLEDWPRLQATEQRQLFFARKFEPIINQGIILRVEQWIKGIDQEQLVNIDAYWQSTYNYLDRSPPPDDSLVTITASVTRLNAKMLSEEGCIIKPGTVREVTSYHFADIFKGSLILHEAIINNFHRVVIETWFKYQQFLQINRSSKYFERLKIFSVSTDYDQKEQVFRNLVRAIGPFSEPSLMYHFIPSTEESSSSNNLTFLWIDSAGNIADINEAYVDEGNVISFIKPNLKVPLLPGNWVVKMLDGKNLVAITKFLVSPLQFISGNEISQQETSMLHGGSVNDYKDFSTHRKTLKPFINTEEERKVAKRRSEANAKRFGSDLKEWIDSLTVQFYSVLGTCVSSKSTENFKCGKINITPCHMTTWSSLAPDPKTFEGRMKKIVNRKDYFNYDI